MDLELKEEGWTRDTNLGIIRLEVIFKAMRMNETIGKIIEDSEEKEMWHKVLKIFRDFIK